MKIPQNLATVLPPHVRGPSPSARMPSRVQVDGRPTRFGDGEIMLAPWHGADQIALFNVRHRELINARPGLPRAVSYLEYGTAHKPFGNCFGNRYAAMASAGASGVGLPRSLLLPISTMVAFRLGR